MPETLPVHEAGQAIHATHAVARLRAERLARASKPFLARGGPKGARCPGCRLPPSHCVCALRLAAPTCAGVCLLMFDTEPLKPSNTGWLVADVVPQTFAFPWARTEVAPPLLALLADPQWWPVVVFPGEFVDPTRVLHELPLALRSASASASASAPAAASTAATATATVPAAAASAAVQVQQPLFIVLDGTWPEARKMLKQSPYLRALPVLSLEPGAASRYRLRRSRHIGHLCTAEVAALCLGLAGEARAAEVLHAWLDLFTHHYLQSKHQLPPELGGQAHRQWRGFTAAGSAP